MIFNFRLQGRNCWDSALRAVLRLHGHPKLLAEADGHDPLVAVERYSGRGSRWIGFSFPQDFGKTISSEGSARILVNGASCFEVEQGLWHRPCGLLSFSCAR